MRRILQVVPLTGLDEKDTSSGLTDWVG